MVLNGVRAMYRESRKRDDAADMFLIRAHVNNNNNRRAWLLPARLHLCMTLADCFIRAYMPLEYCKPVAVGMSVLSPYSLSPEQGNRKRGWKLTVYIK